MRKFLMEISDENMEKALQNLIDENTNISEDDAKTISDLLSESFFDENYSMFKVTEIPQ